MVKHMLFLDYDNVDLEDVVTEVKILQTRFPMLGMAHVFETDHGYHVRFSKARLSEEERNMILELGTRFVHKGYIYFTELVTGTLRVSSKHVKNSIKPFYKFSIVNGEIKYFREVALATCLKRWF